MALITLSDKEFTQFQRFMFEAAGISLSTAKKALISGRLAKRLDYYQAKSFSEYFEIISNGKVPDEIQIALDLLTTNETYFFREPKHFDFLRTLALSARDLNRSFRVWSAASSSGEEAYSIAMVLADCLGEQPWEIIGSDISERVLARARSGHYAIERTTKIPLPYLHRFCRKGIDKQKGTLLVDRTLRSRVHFLQINLNARLPSIGMFDVIFLRNVMIYFNNDTKREVVARLLQRLQPQGHLLIGHSETLNEISDAVRALAPAIYRKL